ncbi:hypothetical protein RU93_GL000579 [Enterococcus aquimarinus]|uniref:Uncharacterized protein n=1 Tax=Enterococcus aquimarinus TaxID=328396 RepID=A0A1L8QQM5_9ENTE|nr:hypothetical protein RU93_GL000579 [Enterococcus aquimarinus]
MKNNQSFFLAIDCFFEKKREETVRNDQERISSRNTLSIKF